MYILLGYKQKFLMKWHKVLKWREKKKENISTYYIY